VHHRGAGGQGRGKQLLDGRPIVRYEFGDEDDEERESTLIVDSIEAADAATDDDKKRPTRTPKNQAAFMTAVGQALERTGIKKRPFNDGPLVRTVTEDQVLERYSRIRADAVPDTRDREFRRQLGNAIKREELIARAVDGETLIWKPDN
jgi:hypothetical protein